MIFYPLSNWQTFLKILIFLRYFQAPIFLTYDSVLNNANTYFIYSVCQTSKYNLFTLDVFLWLYNVQSKMPENRGVHFQHTRYIKTCSQISKIFDILRNPIIWSSPLFCLLRPMELLSADNRESVLYYIMADTRHTNNSYWFRDCKKMT